MKQSPHKRCPIAGCNLVFATPGARGWHIHVRRLDAHPCWHPEAASGNARQSLFVEEFPAFFPPEPEEPAEAQVLPAVDDRIVIRQFVESLRVSLKTLEHWAGPST